MTGGSPRPGIPGRRPPVGGVLVGVVVVALTTAVVGARAPGRPGLSAAAAPPGALTVGATGAEGGLLLGPGGTAALPPGRALVVTRHGWVVHRDPEVVVVTGGSRLPFGVADDIGPAPSVDRVLVARDGTWWELDLRSDPHRPVRRVPSPGPGGRLLGAVGDGALWQRGDGIVLHRADGGSTSVTVGVSRPSVVGVRGTTMVVTGGGRCRGPCPVVAFEVGVGGHPGGVRRWRLPGGWTVRAAATGSVRSPVVADAVDPAGVHRLVVLTEGGAVVVLAASEARGPRPVAVDATGRLVAAGVPGGLRWWTLPAGAPGPLVDAGEVRALVVAGRAAAPGVARVGSPTGA